MASIDSKELIDEIIKGDGYYKDDLRAFAIHSYTTQWGGKCFHIAYTQQQVQRLFDADSAAIKPILLWDRNKSK